MAVTIKSLFENYSGDYKPEEIDWGPDQGKEDYSEEDYLPYDPIFKLGRPTYKSYRDENGVLVVIR